MTLLRMKGFTREWRRAPPLSHTLTALVDGLSGGKFSKAIQKSDKSLNRLIADFGAAGIRVEVRKGGRPTN